MSREGEDGPRVRSPRGQEPGARGSLRLQHAGSCALRPRKAQAGETHPQLCLKKLPPAGTSIRRGSGLRTWTSHAPDYHSAARRKDIRRQVTICGWASNACVWVKEVRLPHGSASVRHVHGKEAGREGARGPLTRRCWRSGGRRWQPHNPVSVVSALGRGRAGRRGHRAESVVLEARRKAEDGRWGPSRREGRGPAKKRRHSSSGVGPQRWWVLEPEFRGQWGRHRARWGGVQRTRVRGTGGVALRGAPQRGPRGKLAVPTSRVPRQVQKEQRPPRPTLLPGGWSPACAPPPSTPSTPSTKTKVHAGWGLPLYWVVGF